MTQTPDTPWETIHVISGDDRVDVAIAAHEHLQVHHAKAPDDGPPSVLATVEDHIFPLLRTNPDALVYIGPIGQVSIDRLVECALTGHKVVVAYNGTAEDFRFATTFGPLTAPHIADLDASGIQGLTGAGF